MTPAEAQVLLSMAAAVDNRKPDPDAAKAWAAMLDGLRFEDCRLAIVEHFKTSTEYLMPIHIRTIARRIRSKRIAEHPPVIPPPNLETFAEQQAWQRELNRRIGDGETFEPNAFYGELKPRDLGDLKALLAAPPPTPEPTTDPATAPGLSVPEEER